MKAILVQLDEYTAKLLDKYVPGRGRKRSKFIREAVIRALMDVAEVETRRAYERMPDEGGWLFDPEQWAAAPYEVSVKRRRRRQSTGAQQAWEPYPPIPAKKSKTRGKR